MATSGSYGFVVDGASGLAPVLTLRAFSLVAAASASASTGVRVDAQAETAHATLDGVRLADFDENGLEALGVLEGPLSSVTIHDSIIENNALAGIEVFNAGLSISDSTVSGNSNGGVRATLDDVLLQVSIMGSTITDNAAELGGGVFLDGASSALDISPQLSVLDSTLDGNTANLDGGGAFVAEGVAVFERAVVSSNSAGRDGGGIFGSEGPDFVGVNLTVTETTLLDNQALAGSGGGLAIRNENSRSALIQRSLLADNVAAQDGGGAFMHALGVAFDNSTLDGNAAARGGGWFYGGISEGWMTNSTVSANSASVEGGGLHFARINALFTGNLIATNSAPSAPDILVVGADAEQPFGYRCLIGNDEGAEGAFPPENDNIVGVDPLLGPRQNLGGPTAVRPLLSGSPAIDAAETGPEIDQRGVSRPQGAAFDIGAFEGSCTENEQQLVTNQGFEANTTAWAGSFGTTISSSTAQAHSGTRSLRISNRNLGTWQGAEYNLLGAAIPGEGLEVNLWARVEGDSSEPVLFTLRSVCQGSSTVYTTVASGMASDTSWVELNGTVEIPNCTLTELVVYAEGPRTGVVLLIDDVSVKRTTLQCAGAQTPLDGTFIVTTDWGTGYCVELRVTNSNTVPTTDWSAAFNLNGTTIYTIWNLDTTGLAGSPTVSPNAPFAQVIQPGANTHSLGFCADRSPGNTALPSEPVVTGVF